MAELHIDPELLRTPVIWGVSDCCTFVCDLLSSHLNRPIGREIIGHYETKDAAYEALRDYGGLFGAIRSLAAKEGFIYVREAEDYDPSAYDIGLLITAEGPAMTVCDGKNFIGRVDYGISITKPKDIARKWICPRP